MNLRNHNRQRGAALIVGLMMLVIVTLLAVTAVSTSSTELIMAGNEQFRERAFQASEAGVESAFRMARSGDDEVPDKDGEPVDLDDYDMGSDMRDVVSTSIERRGERVIGKNKTIAFRLTSTGTSARNSRSVVEAGVWVLAPPDDSNFGQADGNAGDTQQRFSSL